MNRRTVGYVLERMRTRGATLHLSYENGRSVWFLSGDKRPLADGVGPAVSEDAHVIGVGDALLKEGTHSQTYRFAEN
jgi:hypothetical protein